jgi:hypothetical protein
MAIQLFVNSWPLMDIRVSKLIRGSPRQASDCPLALYLQKWVHYIHCLLLDGTYLSDRCFYQQFLRNSHA